MIDISRLLARASQGRRPTGVDRVSLAYIERWGRHAQAIVQKQGWRRIFPHAHSQALFGLLRDPPADFKRQSRWIIARACVPPWPAQDGQGRWAFHLGHTGLDSPGFGAWLHSTRQRAVFFVHDLIPLTHPEYCRPGEQAAHAQRMRVVLDQGAAVVANSHDTLTALQAFAASAGQAMPPSVVAHLAPGLLPSPEAAAPLAQPYFVVLGTVEPRKNHLLLLNVWRALVAAHGAQTPHLVVLGQRGWESENVVDMLERCESLRGFVHEVSGCSDALLATWLRHARALLFPSFAEGYGMPLVEALMMRTPVIASDLPVFREVAGQIPDYLDPTDGPGWARAIMDHTHADGVLPSAQRARMDGFVVPGWEAHFQTVEDFLNALSPRPHALSLSDAA